MSNKEDKLADKPEDFDNLKIIYEELIDALEDLRDNRGKRHDLAYIILGCVLAIMTGKKTLSSIHRFLVNRNVWLKEGLGFPMSPPISRGYLPDLLDRVQWENLDSIIYHYFGFHANFVDGEPTCSDWVAIDGKWLRGTGGEDALALVLAVDQNTGITVGSYPMFGKKDSEIPALRKLIIDSGLCSAKVTFDALHNNPETLTIVAEAGGQYIVQVKDNQEELNRHLNNRICYITPRATLSITEKAHGRVSTWNVRLFGIYQGAFHKRWKPCKILFAIVVDRHIFNTSKQKPSTERSIYITNSPFPANSDAQAFLIELARAIRGHWKVESCNWIRDVTFGEDHIKVKSINQSQIFAAIRTFAINLLKLTNPKNLNSLIEMLADNLALLNNRFTPLVKLGQTVA